MSRIIIIIIIIYIFLDQLKIFTLTLECSLEYISMWIGFEFRWELRYVFHLH